MLFSNPNAQIAQSHLSQISNHLPHIIVLGITFSFLSASHALLCHSLQQTYKVVQSYYPPDAD